MRSPFCSTAGHDVNKTVSARLFALVSALLILVLQGCTGYGSREPQTLFPADSLSRRMAASTPVDTLQQIWIRRDLNDKNDRAYVGSVRFGHAGFVHVADVNGHRLLVFDSTGSPVEEIAHPSFRHPYLIHVSNDTLIVHNAGRSSVDLYVDRTPEASVSVPDSQSRKALSTFAGYLAPHVFVKDLSRQPPRLLRYDLHGQKEASSVPLPAPWWRHRGVLRPWNNRLVAPSAFQPFIYLFDRSLSIDSLRLQGFDSPALNRTRSFVLGDRDEPPLLVPSAAAADNRLFVLNSRPGWIRIDVFDESGVLRHILIQPDPEAGSGNTIDIDVRRTVKSVYEIAVASVDTHYGAFSLTYRSTVTVFRWNAPDEPT